MDMKVFEWIKVVLIVWITLFMTDISAADEWGKVMRAHPNTLIRAERSIHARIKGALMDGDVVKADFFRDGWYAVFDVGEKDRKESRARGYVHASRLYSPRAALSKKILSGEKPAEMSIQKRDQAEDNGIIMKKITSKRERDEKESVCIEFDRFFTPALSILPGTDPRIVLDIPNVSSFKREWELIDVGGSLIKRVRCSIDRKKRMARVVIDMEPTKDYFVQPVFVEKENTYCLVISPDQKK
jgi:hypothetical protein